MSRDELAALREVTASQGIMLETASDRLSARGGPHFGSPDKQPAARLETLRLAGELRVPFTTGILIGIGETREERIEALEAIAGLHREHGHIQEVIVQNFRAKPGTKMAGHAEPSLDDLLWTAAVARLVLPADVHVQCPPNLSYDDFPRLLDAGIDDWGGVSPVTIDHVNPEAPWPEIERLRRRHGGRWARARAPAAGLPRVPRLALARAARADRRRSARRTRTGSHARTAGSPAPRRPPRSRPATRSRSRPASSARTRSRASSPPAATSSTASSPPPTRCAAR